MDDIVDAKPGSYVAVGWFTEDSTYRPLAEAFAANLREHGVPFHLFAKPTLGEWRTTLKPTVALEAMDAYPGRTVVLMDVDCLIRGDLAPVAQIEGDVGVVMFAKDTAKAGRIRHWLHVETSSRIVLFAPTEGARVFAQAWASRIAAARFKHDEWAMMWALLASVPTVRFSFIPQGFSAREIGQIPGAIVEHDSAHDEARRGKRSPMQRLLRSVERPFRRGNTRRARLRGQLILLQGND
jgi:hypothetical protein